MSHTHDGNQNTNTQASQITASSLHSLKSTDFSFEHVVIYDDLDSSETTNSAKTAKTFVATVRQKINMGAHVASVTIHP